MMHETMEEAAEKELRELTWSKCYEGLTMEQLKIQSLKMSQKEIERKQWLRNYYCRVREQIDEGFLSAIAAADDEVQKDPTNADKLDQRQTLYGMWQIENEKQAEAQPTTMIRFDPKRRAFDQAADKWFSPSHYSSYEWYETRANESVVEPDPSSPPAQSLLWEEIEGDRVAYTTKQRKANWDIKKL